MDKVCILISVYHPYRWIAPFTWKLIERFWPDHPPIFFCGLTSEEAGDLPHIPCASEQLPRVWGGFVLDAARELSVRGFTKCYFLLEDHPPLGPCHSEHLGQTLPALMDELGGSYIGLMGWDNRRFLKRGPILPKAQRRLMHLTATQSPRFHLHPSLFRMDTLVGCLEYLITKTNPTPWGFEKNCDKPEAPLKQKWKDGCYQICGEELSLNPAVGLRRNGRQIERVVYHRLMSLTPILQKAGVGMAYWDALGFDNYFYDGPFPMIYSGLMARAKINPFFTRYLKSRENQDPLLQELLTAAETSGFA